MKLEYLAPYLPYKLKFIRNRMDGDKEVYEMACIQRQANGLDVGFYYDTFSTRLHKSKYNQEMEWMSDLVLSMNPSGTDPYMKPVLRPLSDLTKEIEGYDYKKLLEPDLAELAAQENIMPNFRKSDYEILLMHHFDVFGLIDQGLAIDKNTLT